MPMLAGLVLGGLTAGATAGWLAYATRGPWRVMVVAWVWAASSWLSSVVPEVGVNGGQMVGVASVLGFFAASAFRRRG